MRFFVAATLVASVSAAALWGRQAPTSPPACSTPCFNTGTNNISLGNCQASDTACLCRDPVYLQAVINCLTGVCDTLDEVQTALAFSTGYCGVAGVNEFPTTLTTGTPGVPTGTGNHSAATTTSAAATQSHGAASSLKAPAMGVAALVLAAAGLSL